MPSATVRLLCESRSASRTVRDAATFERPFYWRGSSVNFQLALADNGQFLLAPAVGQIIVEVKDLLARPVDDSLMRKVFLTGDCDATFAADDWTGGAKQLLQAHFTVAEAAILPGTYRLVVRHVGVGEDDTENTYLSTELQVMEGQSGSEGIDPPPIAWSYLDAVPVLRYDVAQALTDEQRNRVWTNLDLGALNSFVVVPAANFGERLGMSAATVHNAFVIQGDSSEVFVLPPGGDPENAGDWRKIGEDLSYQLANRADSGMRLLINSLGGFEVALWNVTLGSYRVLRLTGSGAAERIIYADLP